jgi:cell filamentation protein
VLARGIHRRLFEGIYTWAGKYRTVEIAKGRTVFAPVRALKGYADRDILPVFAEKARGSLDAAGFYTALAECWGELNFLHPFREGNGRATQIFVAALAPRHGQTINWSLVDRSVEISAAQAAAEQ